MRGVIYFICLNLMGYLYMYAEETLLDISKWIAIVTIALFLFFIVRRLLERPKNKWALARAMPLAIAALVCIWVTEAHFRGVNLAEYQQFLKERTERVTRERQERWRRWRQKSGAAPAASATETASQP